MCPSDSSFSILLCSPLLGLNRKLGDRVNEPNPLKNASFFSPNQQGMQGKKNPNNTANEFQPKRSSERINSDCTVRMGGCTGCFGAAIRVYLEAGRGLLNMKRVEVRVISVDLPLASQHLVSKPPRRSSRAKWDGRPSLYLQSNHKPRQQTPRLVESSEWHPVSPPPLITLPSRDRPIDELRGSCVIVIVQSLFKPTSLCLVFLS